MRKLIIITLLCSCFTSAHAGLRDIEINLRQIAPLGYIELEADGNYAVDLKFWLKMPGTQYCPGAGLCQ